MVLEKSSLIIHIPRLLGLGLQVQLRKKWRMQVRAEAMQGRVTTSSSKRSSYTAYGHDKQYNSHSTCKFQENSLGILTQHSTCQNASFGGLGGNDVTARNV